MLTVGAGVVTATVAMELLPPQPLNSRGSKKPEANKEEIQWMGL
jgi:hypothetical protein